jgi:hypothetical protein
MKEVTMELGHWGKLTVSILLLAPGVFVVALFLVLGVLAALEKWGVLARGWRRREEDKSRTGKPVGACNPEPGDVVADLKHSIEAKPENWRVSRLRIEKGCEAGR